MLPSEINDDAVNALEALANLIYLVEHEGDHKNRLGIYAKLAQKTLERLTTALRRL